MTKGPAGSGVFRKRVPLSLSLAIVFACGAAGYAAGVLFPSDPKAPEQASLQSPPESAQAETSSKGPAAAAPVTKVALPVTSETPAAQPTSPGTAAAPIAPLGETKPTVAAAPIPVVPPAPARPETSAPGPAAKQADVAPSEKTAPEQKQVTPAKRSQEANRRARRVRRPPSEEGAQGGPPLIPPIFGLGLLQ